ncbi:hypothetical protein [Gordonia sp. DT101]|uniref:hypothetical protein n=1 Tax=Gordonia sp. DT101 TaxID=3416545 RepID=UPI003CEAAF92
MATLAASTDQRVQALYASYERGEIDEATFVELATAVLVQGESKAVSLSDLALAATLTAYTAAVVTPVGLLPDRGAQPRAVEAIREALADPEPKVKLTINVRAVTLEAAQRNTGKAMKKQGVEKWTRKLNAGACKVCTDLAGEELPVTAEMWTHKGCACTQNPITESEKS